MGAGVTRGTRTGRTRPPEHRSTTGTAERASRDEILVIMRGAPHVQQDTCDEESGQHKEQVDAHPAQNDVLQRQRRGGMVDHDSENGEPAQTIKRRNVPRHHRPHLGTFRTGRLRCRVHLHRVSSEGSTGRAATIGCEACPVDSPSSVSDGVPGMGGISISGFGLRRASLTNNTTPVVMVASARLKTGLQENEVLARQSGIQSGKTSLQEREIEHVDHRAVEEGA